MLDMFLQISLTQLVQEKDYLTSGGVSVFTKLVLGRNLPVSSELFLNSP